MEQILAFVVSIDKVTRYFRRLKRHHPLPKTFECNLQMLEKNHVCTKEINNIR
jgi:hypothetical protein